MYSPNNVKFMHYRKDCTPMQLLRLMNCWQIHRQELERVLISLPRVCRFVIIKQDTYVIQVRGSTERRVTKVQLKGLFGKTLNIDMKNCRRDSVRNIQRSEPVFHTFKVLHPTYFGAPAMWKQAKRQSILEKL